MTSLLGIPPEIMENRIIIKYFSPCDLTDLSLSRISFDRENVFLGFWSKYCGKKERERDGSIEMHFQKTIQGFIEKIEERALLYRKEKIHISYKAYFEAASGKLEKNTLSLDTQWVLSAIALSYGHKLLKTPTVEEAVKIVFEAASILCDRKEKLVSFFEQHEKVLIPYYQEQLDIEKKEKAMFVFFARYGMIDQLQSLFSETMFSESTEELFLEAAQTYQLETLKFLSNDLSLTIPQSMINNIISIWITELIYFKNKNHDSVVLLSYEKIYFERLKYLLEQVHYEGVSFEPQTMFIWALQREFFLIAKYYAQKIDPEILENDIAEGFFLTFVSSNSIEIVDFIFDVLKVNLSEKMLKEALLIAAAEKYNTLFYCILEKMYEKGHIDIGQYCKVLAKGDDAFEYVIEKNADFKREGVNAAHRKPLVFRQKSESMGSVSIATGFTCPRRFSFL